MQKIIKYLLVGLLLGIMFPASGHINPKLEGIQNGNITTATLREDCEADQKQIEQSINNVRATLLTGGDIWWNGADARYVVPKVDPLSGLPEVSSIFAGAVWLGGIDDGNNLKVACQQYGSGGSDFWPGPLTDVGTTSKDTCSDWDQFFVVTGQEIQEHIANYAAAESTGQDYDSDLIPAGVKFWPGRGNRFFNEQGGFPFELPNTTQGLAPFNDENSPNGIYNPDQGDYPIIEIRGCEQKFYPDEMIYWIYNDAGNTHTESGGDAIRMEVQVQAFAFKTNDEINDMTFMRYKLINRAVSNIDSMFFAMWVDADLGCYTDDYIGCDTTRSLMYIYNQDELDGETGCSCPQGVNTYCDEVPILGVDYFRGPLGPKVYNILPNGDTTLVNPPIGVSADTIVELGMSSFTYFNNGSGNPPPPPGTDDPSPGVSTEFYNYISGSWKDGLPFTQGGDGHNPGQTNVVSYAFPDAPNQVGGWSMSQEALPAGDRRTVQASGPFRLEPGAVNELIVGAVWVPDIAHPNPDITKLQAADDVAQALFNNCFEIPNGPDAPDVDWIELDREVVAVFTNDSLFVRSNNAFEMYEEKDLRSEGQEDSTYVFEGYKLYQLSGPDVGVSELDDPDKARIVFQVDKKNNVMDLYNWSSIPNPTSDDATDKLWSAEGKVENAENKGIRHLFKITQDQFASEDRKLVNHKKYYFTAIAYGFNEYLPFNPDSELGQKLPYIEGRRNIGDQIAGTDYYTVIPRPVVHTNLNAGFGDSPEITRLDGTGAGGNFLRLTEESAAEVFDGSYGGIITYQEGSGPLEVKVYNPFDLIEGEFEITIIDDTPNDLKLPNDTIISGEGIWRLRQIDGGGSTIGEPTFSELTIDRLNEQVLPELGFAINLSQTNDAGSQEDETSGLIGWEAEYADINGVNWMSAVPDDTDAGQLALFNYMKTSVNENYYDRDRKGTYKTVVDGAWFPYTLSDAISSSGPLLSPASDHQFNGAAANQNPVSNLNNVNIVFTSDKSKWSRCVVIETAQRFHYDDEGLETEGDVENFGLRAGTSRDRDGNPQTGSTGMSYFPGYAIDVESGKRLNIFFGENSTMSCEEPTLISQICDSGAFLNGDPTGRDMIWNPNSDLFVNTGLPGFSLANVPAGGQHYIYVTSQTYDECASIRVGLSDPTNNGAMVGVLKSLTWTSFPILNPGTSLNSIADGLIPNDYTVRLRVDSPYDVDLVNSGSGVNNGYPTYRFSTIGMGASELASEEDFDTALDAINVVPNPYYGYSAYETSQFTNVVKITNLPAECTVTLYSLDGKFIRQYKRNEQGIPTNARSNPAIDISQYSPAVEWDLKNAKGIPVASGVYLIHVDAGIMGERVIKWFGVARQFDPSGL